MHVLQFFLLLVCLGLEIAAQLLMKRATRQPAKQAVQVHALIGSFAAALNTALVCALVCYGLEWLVWLAFLAMTDLSKALLMSALSIVMLGLCDRLLYKTALPPLSLFAGLLIVCGFFLLGV